MKLDSDHEVIVDLSEEIPKTNLIATTPQSQLKTKSSTIEPAIPSNNQTENVDEVSATASASEILETPKAASPPVTPTSTSLMASPAGEANDDHESGHSPTRKRPMEISFSFQLALMASLYMIFVLILSASMNKLEYKASNLEIWKWCCLGLSLLLSLPLADCFIFMCCFLINKIILFGKKNNDEFKDISKFLSITLKSCRGFLCLGLIFSIWTYLIGPRQGRLKDATKVLRYIYKGIECAVPVAFAWMLRILAMEFLHDSFYIKRFSKRIQENHFHQNILQTLSGTLSGSGELSKVQTPQEMIIHMMFETAPPTTFCTLPNTLDKSKDLMYPNEQNNRIITTERKAKAVGDHIFTNVAKPEHKYIEEEDLLRFMKKEEVDMVLPLIGGKEESGRINEKPFLNWVVSMYMKSEFLKHSLNDIKEAMKTLLKFVNVLLVAVLIILWLILMRIATNEVMLFISSQFLLAVFTFGNSAKSTFEALILVFLKHPFDVGDRCVIDSVQVVVEEVSILTTVFLNDDNEKIYYPNSILATKSISNLSRSPEMRDKVEFDLDVSTSVENISALKANIKTYIDSKPHLWRPKHSVRVREIADVNKMKMRLYVTHTLNYLNYEEKCDRRSNLVLELRNIFQQLGIEDYQILPSTSSD